MELSKTQRNVLELMAAGEELTCYTWGGNHYSVGYSTVRSQTVDALRHRDLIVYRKDGWPVDQFTGYPE